MRILIKSSAKMTIIAGLTIGFSVIGLAQSKGSTSIISTISNQNAIKNTMMTPMNEGGKDGGKDGGKEGGKDGGSGGKDGGKEGGKSGGSDGGHGSDGGGGCVPEPMSMLALGIGAGVVAFKRRRATKVA